MKKIYMPVVKAALLVAALLAAQPAAAQFCWLNCDFTRTKNPVVLQHGLAGFNELGGVLPYWNGIPESLRSGGAEVFVTQVSPFNSSVVRGESLMRDNDGDACSRAVLAAASPTEADAITLALYRACWSEGKTLATSGDILAAIAAAGLDAASIAARLDAADVVAQLDANTDEAVERGVFGSPSIFVGDTMFFGNDRLEFVREELARLEKAA